MSFATFPAALGILDRLSLILTGLRGVVAARMAADRTLVPLLTLLWSRLRRAQDRFARLAVPARMPTPETIPDSPPQRAARPSGPRERLPRGFAWLLRLLPEAAAYGTQLQALLADPDMAELLAAVPRAGRIVRPLCRMLAVSPGLARLGRISQPESKPGDTALAPAAPAEPGPQTMRPGSVPRDEHEPAIFVPA